MHGNNAKFMPLRKQVPVLTLSHEHSLHQVIFEDFGFQYDESLAKTVSIIEHTGGRSDQPCCPAEPPCIRFLLSNEPLSYEHRRSAGLHP
jgi:hypothetical protein